MEEEASAEEERDDEETGAGGEDGLNYRVHAVMDRQGEE